MLVALTFLGLVLPLPAYQQEPFVVCSETSSGDHWALGCTFTDLLMIPVRIFNYALGFAAFVLLGVIVFAGLRMMWYHMAESPSQELEAAKYTLTRGIVGFSIVVGAILIVNTLLFVLGLSGASDVGNWLSDPAKGIGIWN